MVRQNKQDRFLVLRGGIFYYWRRVPVSVADSDDRAPFVRLSLKTDDLAHARAKRDILEQSDNDLWASIRSGECATTSRVRFEAARRRAESVGFTYKPAEEVARQDIDEIVQRVLAVMGHGASKAVEASVLGGAGEPDTTVSDAFKVYCKEIALQELATKSAAQRKLWKDVKQRAIDSFIAVIEDKPIGKITRDDARKFYQFWLAKVTSKKPAERRSPSSGNRHVGNMRVLYDEYFKYLNQPDRENPFAGLSFSERKKMSRPPFSVEWLRDKIMAPGALAGMNEDGRGIVLAMIETGARPSELCNLTRASIRLKDAVPHLMIEPRDDPEDPREIKTETSVRSIPLVGIAHEVFKRHPNGFPRYRDKESALSTALLAYFRNNKLLPTKRHVIYSIRHAFEDRMKEGGLDSELRRMLMGHTIDRPKYGSGGSLEWKQKELLKIVLPFDPAIV